MKRAWRKTFMAAATLALLAGISRVGPPPVPGATCATPAAKVRAEIITLGEVEEVLKPKLARIEARYAAALTSTVLARTIRAHDDQVPHRHHAGAVAARTRRRGLLVDAL